MNFEQSAKSVFVSLAILGVGVTPFSLVYAQTGPTQGMDHSHMQGMDDGQLQGMKPAASQESRTPIPALTNADRAAVFESHDPQHMPGKTVFFTNDQHQLLDLA